MKYKHIYDYFDKDGKYVGGAEPLTESTEEPVVNHHQGLMYVAPAYILYIGWCEEDEPIFSGLYPFDVVHRNHETKQLTRDFEMVDDIVGCSYKIHKTTKMKGFKPNLEYACKYTGRAVPEEYLKLKEEKENTFNTEYQKVVKDKEYFREKYYYTE